MAARYPTPEDRKEHMPNFPDITKLWDAMIAKVDELMSDVTI
jgi:hypothetical protein